MKEQCTDFLGSRSGKFDSDYGIFTRRTNESIIPEPDTPGCYQLGGLEGATSHPKRLVNALRQGKWVEDSGKPGVAQ